jgi:hypothetical protein
MHGRITSTYALAALLTAVAVALSMSGTVLAQQTPMLIAAKVQALPIDPADPVWAQATAASVPLTPQAVALPRQMQVSVPTVSVRTLTDGERIAFRLEWDDATRDAQAIRPDQFRDAAALMLGVDNTVPNICMGVVGQLANLWHWKADWQEDIDKGFQDVVDAYPNFYKDSYPYVTGAPPFRAPADFGSAEARQYFIGLAAGNPLARPQRSSPVEELLSTGYGTVTHRDQQGVDGKGVWANGRWSVVFARPLQSPESSGANLAGRSDFPAAFAVWNGSNQEVGARKQLSGLITVQVGPRSATVVGSEVEIGWAWLIWLVLGGLIVAFAAWLGWWQREQEIRGSARRGG